MDADGPAAPPRKNGELVFEAPWESRAFGMAVTLHERGLFEWEEFRRRLIREIGAWERAHPEDAEWSYYARWLAALEALLAEKGICPGPELDRRASELAARPHGHDHGTPSSSRSAGLTKD